MVTQVALFPLINNAIGAGKLYLPVGTTEIFICGVGERYYVGWSSSRPESLSMVDRIGREDMYAVSVSHRLRLTFSDPLQISRPNTAARSGVICDNAISGVGEEGV